MYKQHYVASNFFETVKKTAKGFLRINKFPCYPLLIVYGLSSLIFDPCFGQEQELITRPLEYSDAEELVEKGIYFPAIQKQVDLNQATFDELFALHILDIDGVNSIILYRNTYGPFLSIYELQAIPNLGLEEIRALESLCFVSTTSPLKVPFRQLRSTNNQLLLRWKTSNNVDSSKSPSYGLLGRYEFDNNYNIRAGLLFENDIGEAVSFSSDRTMGFDHVSAYVEMRNLTSWMNKLLIGDFRVHMGQGLIHSLAFNMGKGLQINRLNRMDSSIRPNRSIDENRFHRGIATSIDLTNTLNFDAFYSSKFLDATIYNDSLNGKYFRSLYTSGYHRDSLELSKRHTLSYKAVGLSVGYHSENLSLGYNLISHYFGIPARNDPSPSNLYRNGGRSLFNMSLDYQINTGNIHCFGELGIGRKATLGITTGMMLSIHPKLDIGILYRHLPPGYLHFWGQPFADNARGQNEYGLQFNLAFRPVRKWAIETYIDNWYNPWLTHGLDQPAYGQAYRMRIQYQKRHHYTYYVQLALDKETSESKVDNSRITGIRSRWRFKYYQGIELSKSLEWRTRFYYNITTKGKEYRSSGWMFTQDILFRPMLFPLGFTARIAWYNTSDFKSRIYAFENNVLEAFSIPAYQGRGFRYYINIRGKISKTMTAEGRIATTLPYVDEELALNRSNPIANISYTIQMRLKF